MFRAESSTAGGGLLPKRSEIVNVALVPAPPTVLPLAQGDAITSLPPSASMS